MKSACLLLAACLPLSAMAQSGCIQPPASCAPGSKFGYRSDPVPGGEPRMQFHKGMDFRCAMNTPIYASTSGRVMYADFERNGGNMVKIDNGNGIVTKYLHNNRLGVQTGQTVAAGTKVADSGNTGHRTTGPHLHFAVENKGMPVDPALLVCGMGSQASPLDPKGVAMAPAGDSPDDPGAAGPGVGRMSGIGRESPDGFEGSLHAFLAQVSESRFLNPDWYAQISTLDEARLYDELARMEAISMRIDFQKTQHRERIAALLATSLSLRKDQAVRPATEAARAAGQQ